MLAVYIRRKWNIVQHVSDRTPHKFSSFYPFTVFFSDGGFSACSTAALQPHGFVSSSSLLTVALSIPLPYSTSVCLHHAPHVILASNHGRGRHFLPPRSVAPWFGQSVDEVVGNQIELSLGDVTRGQQVASYSITTPLATSSLLRRRMPAAGLDREPESVVWPEEHDDDDDQSGVWRWCCDSFFFCIISSHMSQYVIVDVVVKAN